MAITLAIEGGHVLRLTDDDNAIETFEELESVFEGTAYIDMQGSDPNPNNFLFSITPDTDLSDYSESGNYVRIVEAEWEDLNPPTSFHSYVIGLMNRESPKVLEQIADGYDGAAPLKIWDALFTYTIGFEEAVEAEIKSKGLEFVFGNGFSFYGLFSYIVREIVREYLRNHELYERG